jgi:hypothetical protein
MEIAELQKSVTKYAKLMGPILDCVEGSQEIAQEQFTRACSNLNAQVLRFLAAMVEDDGAPFNDSNGRDTAGALQVGQEAAGYCELSPWTAARLRAYNEHIGEFLDMGSLLTADVALQLEERRRSFPAAIYRKIEPCGQKWTQHVNSVYKKEVLASVDEVTCATYASAFVKAIRREEKCEDTNLEGSERPHWVEEPQQARLVRYARVCHRFADALVLLDDHALVKELNGVIDTLVDVLCEYHVHPSQADSDDDGEEEPVKPWEWKSKGPSASVIDLTTLTDPDSTSTAVAGGHGGPAVRTYFPYTLSNDLLGATLTAADNARVQAALTHAQGSDVLLAANPRATVCTTKFTVDLLYRHLECLLDDKWLTDAVINPYLATVQHATARVCILNTFMFQLYSQRVQNKSNQKELSLFVRQQLTAHLLQFEVRVGMRGVCGVC